MLKRVRYNGGKQFAYNLTNPDILNAGQIYSVVDIKIEKETITIYSLEEVEGRFNAIWFDEIDEK